MTGPAGRCPDGGYCHGSSLDAGSEPCAPGDHCYRVATSGPLPGVFPGDRWPHAVLAANGVACGCRPPAQPAYYRATRAWSEGWLMARRGSKADLVLQVADLRYRLHMIEATALDTEHLTAAVQQRWDTHGCSAPERCAAQAVAAVLGLLGLGDG